jgi:uncharacterized protein (DUF1810 family)
MHDPFDLGRFLDAQNTGGLHDAAMAELRRGRKTSHWMWFVFPQIAGLGNSSMSRQYAISGLDEARAYLQHPVLGPRLLEASNIVAQSRGGTAERIFGDIDAQKLRSSMTLFCRADPVEPVFGTVLDRFSAGLRDPLTERLLGFG